MSHNITNAIRKLDLPPTAKFILWVLSDIANDAGHCYPSREHLAIETGLGRTAISDALKTLEAYGVLQVDRSNGRQNHYTITPQNYAKPDRQAVQSAKRTGPFNGTTRPAGGLPPDRLTAQPDRQAVTNHQEPSYKPSGNHQDTREQTRPEPAAPRAKKSEPAHQLPDWINPEAWAGFVEMRRKIKKPLTDRAVSLAIGRLEELRRQGQDPNAVLDQSTFKNWQGLFAIKQDKPQAPPADKWACLSDGSLLSQSEVRDVNDPFCDQPKAKEPSALTWEHGHA